MKLVVSLFALTSMSVPCLPAQTVERQSQCAELQGRHIAADLIGAPSGGAVVMQASPELEPGGITSSTGYCRVVGDIQPKTVGAQPIRFRLDLPDTWNSKLLMLGGGGFNGSVASGTGPLHETAPSSATPLARGYVVASSDSGHATTGEGDPEVGAFALNDEMLRNFAYESYKKVRDVADQITTTYYGHSPTRRYYYGWSEGGREGITMAQRYPKDIDGVVASSPVISWSGLTYGFTRMTEPQITDGYLTLAEVQLLSDAITRKCDALDGLADGVVNNYLGCARAFHVEDLQCSQGQPTPCLSTEKVATLRAVYEPVQRPSAAENGDLSYPGRLFGGELAPNNYGLTRWITAGRKPFSEISASDSIGVLYGRNMARYLLVQDPAWNQLRFDGAPYADRLRVLSRMMDSTNADLSAFATHGGKMIIRENGGDLAQSPLAGFHYYASVRQKMGAAQTESFLRLYVSPASSHAGAAVSTTTGQTVPTDHDLLDDLDRWVTTGTPPADRLVQTATESKYPFKVIATRPMCRYPAYPRYEHGDTGDEASYRCVEDSSK